MTNPFLEILVSLGIDSVSSRRNIEQYISQLKNLPSIKVDIDVGEIKNAQRAIEDFSKTVNSNKNNTYKVDTSQAVKELKLVGLALDELKRDTSGKGGTLDIRTNADGVIRSITQSFTNARNEVEKIRFTPRLDMNGFQVFDEVGAKISNIVNKDSIKALEQLNKEVEKFYRKGSISDEDRFKFENINTDISVKEIKELQKELQKLASLTSFEQKINNATNSISESFTNLNSRLDLTMNKLGSNIDTSKLDIIRNKMNQLGDMEIVNETSISKANALIDSLNRRITDLTTSGNSMDRFNAKFEQATKALDDLEREGFASETAIRKLRTQLESVQVGNLNQAKDALKQIKNEAEGINKSNKLDIGVQDVTNGVSKLQAELQKTINLYRKTVNMDMAKDIGASIARIGQIDLINPASVAKAKKEIREVREAIRTLNADATIATRNSMNIIESFKVAMSKFPVWMAASTIFYSSINSAKEFMRIIVDIDTKLTNISKVISDDMDIGTILDQATLSAEKFGQSISAALDAYTEFARQGFKGEDLAVLSDAGLVAANVGELSAQQASEFMTSALVQWDKDVTESMGVIDSWNSISNNYATTVLKMAEGQSKAG